jgi:hypothetical protein
MVVEHPVPEDEQQLARSAVREDVVAHDSRQVVAVEGDGGADLDDLSLGEGTQCDDAAAAAAATNADSGRVLGVQVPAVSGSSSMNG